MTNESNTSTPRPLTDVEVAARKAIIEAASKVAETAPAKPADAVATPAPTVDTAKPEKPASDQPTGIAKGDSASPLGGKLPPTIGPVTNTAAPQSGVKPTGDAAMGTAILAKVSSKPKAKPKAKQVTVAAVQTPKLGKAATAMANPSNVEGFALHKWPVIKSPVDGKPVPPPARVDIIAARALGVAPGGPTANLLALAFYLSSYADKLNLYDASMAGGKYVLGLSGDHKMNVALKAASDGLLTIDKSTSLPFANGTGGGRGRACYVCTPTAKGMKLIMPALDAAKLAVPKRWLPANGGNKPADKGNKPAAATVAPAA